MNSCNADRAVMPSDHVRLVPRGVTPLHERRPGLRIARCEVLSTPGVGRIADQPDPLKRRASTRVSVREIVALRHVGRHERRSS